MSQLSLFYYNTILFSLLLLLLLLFDNVFPLIIILLGYVQFWNSVVTVLLILSLFAILDPKQIINY